MENIIKKAIEGGAFGNPEKLKDVDWFIKEDLIFWNRKNQDGVSISLHKQLMRAEFWQALGKACGWKQNNLELAIPKMKYELHENGCVTKEWNDKDIPQWMYHALRFHEINLTEGWDKAVEYLASITNPQQ